MCCAHLGFAACLPRKSEFLNTYLEPAGIFGTGASLLADLTLIAYLIILIPAMVIGFSYARRRKFRPQHRWVMTFVTIANWALIVFLMLAAYRFDVVDNISRQRGNLRYLLPTLHAVLGLPAQLLATFIIGRMALEGAAVSAAKRRGETAILKYHWRWAKPFMQTTLALWLATATLGIASYVIRYNVVETVLAPGGAAPGAITPAVTPEVALTPEATEETDEAVPESSPIPEPNATEEVRPVATDLPSWWRYMTPIVIVTPEVALTLDVTPAPVVIITPEVRAADTPAPVVVETPEVALTPEVEANDDNSGRGLGRGRGGGSNSDSDSDDDSD